MGKHNHVKHRARGNLPASNVPYPIQNRILRENNQELKRVLNKVQRLLWIAVQDRGGRIEMSESDYHMAMQTPGEDCITSTEYDEREKKVAIVFTNEKGERLPESDKPLVVLTDG